jgi:hypothetical protein
MPIVYRLEELYGDQIEFVPLNVDDRTTLNTRRAYNLTGRSQYILVEPDDSPIKFWYGPLPDSILDEVGTILAGL